MRRRDFIALLGGGVALAGPLAAQAQQPTLPVIGFLSVGRADEYQPRIAAFHRGLQEYGYVEGQNVAIEYRWADGRSERLSAMAADLVNRRVAVIAATGSPAALAVKTATTAIPIVFETGFDPISLGLVANLNRPGGNVTGITSLNAVVTPKRLELLHELIPKASVMALLVNPANRTSAENETTQALTAAQKFGVELHVLNARSESDFDGAFSKLAEFSAGGLVIGADPLFFGRSESLGALAVRYRVPAVSESRSFVTAGGLASYGGSVIDSYRVTGIYVARILKGEKPADLPVQQGTKVELFINLRAAKTLGITVPLTISGRADDVID